MKNKKTIAGQALDVALWLSFICLSALICFLTFSNLNELNINIWDEARHGVNAYEMILNDEYIVSTYKNEIDLFNTKPPLSYWLIAISFKLLGYTKFALRLPSAIALLLCIAISTLYALKKYGLVAANIVLLCSAACTTYYDLHFGKAADADSLFVLLSTVFILCLIESQNRPFLLSFCGLSFSLAFLAKSWHAANLVVIALLFLTICKCWKAYSLRQYISAFACGALPILAWAIARFSKDGPVFFQMMIGNDLLRRTASILEGHRGGIAYYIDFIFINSPWSIFAIAIIFMAIGAAVFAEKKRPLVLEPAIVAFVLCIMVPLVLYSIASTKLQWYVFMVLPAVILLVSRSLIYLLSLLPKDIKLKYFALAILFVPILLTLRYALLNIRFVNTVHTDALETAIFATTERSDEYNLVPAFLQTDANKIKWTQEYLLAAQLAGNLSAMDGGIEAFIAYPNSAIIFVSKNIYEDNAMRFIGLDITPSPSHKEQPDDYYYMIKK